MHLYYLRFFIKVACFEDASFCLNVLARDHLVNGVYQTERFESWPSVVLVISRPIDESPFYPHRINQMQNLIRFETGSYWPDYNYS